MSDEVPLNSLDMTRDAINARLEAGHKLEPKTNTPTPQVEPTFIQKLQKLKNRFSRTDPPVQKPTPIDIRTMRVAGPLDKPATSAAKETIFAEQVIQTKPEGVTVQSDTSAQVSDLRRQMQQLEEKRALNALTKEDFLNQKDALQDQLKDALAIKTEKPPEKQGRLAKQFGKRN